MNDLREERELKELATLPPEEFKRRVFEKAESVVVNLKKAWEVRPADLSHEEEEQLLQALSKAKRLRDTLKEIFEKGTSSEGAIGGGENHSV